MKELSSNTFDAGVETEAVMVSPAVAQELLQRDALAREATGIRARPVSLHRVDTYVNAMRRGEWLINGETMSLAEDGLVMDGHHRLRAIIKSGVTVPLLVVVGVSHEAFATINRGRVRSRGDIAALAGLRDGRNIMAAASRVMTYATTGHFVDKLGHGASKFSTTPNLIAFIMRDRDRWEAASLFSNSVPLPICTRSAATAWYWLVDHPAKARFIDQIVTGVNLTPSAPAHIVRERALRGLPLDERVELFIRAWNAEAEGQQPKTIRLKGECPVIVGSRLVPERSPGGRVDREPYRPTSLAQPQQEATL